MPLATTAVETTGMGEWPFPALFQLKTPQDIHYLFRRRRAREAEKRTKFTPSRSSLGRNYGRRKSNRASWLLHGLRASCIPGLSRSTCWFSQERGVTGAGELAMEALL